jgi:hypothetical protein
MGGVYLDPRGSFMGYFTSTMSGAIEAARGSPSGLADQA